MKRRNAENSKMRRPVKRTKITEGMYGSSMLYLKFVMLWASVVLVDYILEFRFEFLWPVYMMLKSVYDSYKYQGLAFSFFFVCITITSDMICFCFIPLQYIFFVASTYVWVQYVWYTLCVRGGYFPLWLALASGLAGALLELGVGPGSALAPGWGRRRAAPPAPLAPLAAITVGHGVFVLAKGAKSFLCHRIRVHWQRKVREHNEAYFQFLKEQLHSDTVLHPECPFRNMESTETESEPRVRKRTADVPPPKVDKKDSQMSSQTPHKYSNGFAHGGDEDKNDLQKASAKPKCEKKEGSSIKEEKRKKIRDKDSDSHKSTEQPKEQILKENTNISTNSSTNVRKDNSITREKEVSQKERELREREREIEREIKEREKEREKELRETREMCEELKRVRSELSSCKASEHEAKKALTVALDKQKQMVDSQQKMSLWRSSEKAVLERTLRDEKRARVRAELKLARAQHTRHSGECENEWCKSTRAELTSLKRDLARQTEQIRTLESSQSSPNSQQLVSELRSRCQHLEKALSAETRVKLDLLSALGAAKRHISIQEGLISRQEKELDELKAQMLAVMPTEYIQKNSRKYSLDPNASAYTPTQLLTDA